MVFPHLCSRHGKVEGTDGKSHETDITTLNKLRAEKDEIYSSLKDLDKVLRTGDSGSEDEEEMGSPSPHSPSHLRKNGEGAETEMENNNWSRSRKMNIEQQEQERQAGDGTQQLKCDT